VRPVDQTSYGFNTGDCFSACLASILEIPIDVVPLFLGPHHTSFLPWLARLGLGATRYTPPQYTYLPQGYSIAAGPSKRFGGRLHACVAYNGSVVHDPHPSRDGLPLGVTEYVVIHTPLSG
jgi:hypothetical protein